jgi:HlyD family secretion protein
VKQGDVLARIVPLAAPLLDARSRKTAEAQVKASAAALRQANAAIERARVALTFARTQANRERELVKHGGTTQAAVERAELEQRSREADVTSAEFAARVASYEHQMAEAALGRHDARPGAALDDQMVLPSPIGGRVLKVFQESEGVVQAGAPLVELGDPEALEVVVDVLTSDAVQIAPGAAVTLERWGGAPLRASVRLVEPSAFTKLSSLGVEEQRVNAVIDLRDPYAQWSALGDGYRVEARIVAWRADEVLRVPSSAVFRHGEGWAVYVVEQGAARLTPVVLGRRSTLEAQVESGLAEGTPVVVHPGDRVRDGVRLAER